MFFYTDDLERFRQYLFQYNFLLEHSKSVFRFAVPCIKRWMGYFGILSVPSNSSKLHTNRNVLQSVTIFHHLCSFCFFINLS